MGEKKQVVVKVQLPLASNTERPEALVYNYDRSIQTLMPVTEALLKGFEEDEVKAFFHATVEETDDGLTLELVAKAPMKDW